MTDEEKKTTKLLLLPKWIPETEIKETVAWLDQRTIQEIIDWRKQVEAREKGGRPAPLPPSGNGQDSELIPITQREFRLFVCFILICCALYCIYGMCRNGLVR